MSKTKKATESLRKELKQHNHNYYVLDAPTISDYEYDMRMKELEALEAEHPELEDPASPSVCVGSDLSTEIE